METLAPPPAPPAQDAPGALTPRQIVAELDRYVVGQDAAKKSVAIALRNRWRRLQAPPALREEIAPNNILMIGPTGVGKTEIARRLARLSGAPFVKVEATKFTEVGYVGRDVESMIRDLVDLAVNEARREQAERVREQARANAEERVLNALLPGSRPRRTAGALFGTFGAAGQTPEPEPDLDEAGNRTRERLREKLRDGQLDEREVEIEVTVSGSANIPMLGPGMEEMGQQLQDMLGAMAPKQRKKRRVKVAEALELMTQEEAEKLVDQEAAKTEALRRVEGAGIVFIDEIDKVAGRQAGGQSGPDVSREGVQRDLLPIVEGSTVMTKHGPVRTDHILFIASGAFHIARPSDLIPELQGRFPIRVELSSLTEDDFVKILTVPTNALLKQYAALFEVEGVTLTFTDDAVRAIARTAASVNATVEDIGARRLHTILTTLLEEALFGMPDEIGALATDGDGRPMLAVDAAYVHDRLAAIAGDRDLSQYIL
ncbi:MAG TPA: ATP-dependent protease ATPase subunit HslU [Rhodothermales bacterium]|nr:ATP-dependent protease ATPase subunit HslU [Rhodothermales bacterium]